MGLSKLIFSLIRWWGSKLTENKSKEGEVFTLRASASEFVPSAPMKLSRKSKEEREVLTLRCKHTCHAGDFFLGHYSACLFFCNYPKSGENILYLKADLFTPRNWENHPFTLLANFSYLFYNVAWTQSASCRKDSLKVDINLKAIFF